MTLVDQFEPVTSKKREKTLITVYEEWNDIFYASIMCGNEKTTSITKRTGMTKIDKEKLKEAFGGKFGVKGIVELKAGIKREKKIEYQFESFEENKFEFKAKAPQYGKMITSIFQLKRIFHIKTIEMPVLPFNHPVESERTAIQWLQRFENQANRIDLHPDCHPPKDIFQHDFSEAQKTYGGVPVQLSFGNGVTFTGSIKITPEGFDIPGIGLLPSNYLETMKTEIKLSANNFPSYIGALVGKLPQEEISVTVIPYDSYYELSPHRWYPRTTDPYIIYSEPSPYKYYSPFDPEAPVDLMWTQKTKSEGALGTPWPTVTGGMFRSFKGF